MASRSLLDPAAAKGLEQRSRLEAAQYWPNLMQYQPRNLKDLWNLSNGYFAVGLQDRGLELIQKAADQFGLAPSYWVGLGQYLLRSRAGMTPAASL